MVAAVCAVIAAVSAVRAVVLAVVATAWVAAPAPPVSAEPRPESTPAGPWPNRLPRPSAAFSTASFSKLSIRSMMRSPTIFFIAVDQLSVPPSSPLNCEFHADSTGVRAFCHSCAVLSAAFCTSSASCCEIAASCFASSRLMSAICLAVSPTIASSSA